MDYGEVLSKAWQITWKYKVLWIFGILAGCGGQLGSNSFNYSVNGDGGGPITPGGPSNLPPGLERFSNGIEQWVNQLSTMEIVLFGLAMLVVSVLLVVIFTTLGTIGRIGLVKGTLEGDRGTVQLTFGELFQHVQPYFWRVIGLGLLLGLGFLTLGFVITVIVVILSVFTLGIGLICLAPLLCLFVPLGWFVNIIVQQAYTAMIVDDLSIIEALSRGWEVTRENAGPMILMGLILMVGVIIIGGGLVALPFTLIALPALGGLALGTDQAFQGGLLLAGLCFVLYLPVMIVLGGMIRTYYESAWTLTYLRLTRPTQISMETV